MNKTDVAKVKSKKSAYGVNITNFSVLLIMALLAAKAHLGIGILLAAIGSIAFIIFDKKDRLGLFIPNFIFLPIFILTLGSSEVGDGVSASAIARGRVAIASWIIAIVYLVFAMVYHLFTPRMKKKLIPPYFAGALSIVFAALFMVGILVKFTYVPLDQGGVINYIGISNLVLFVFLFYLFNSLSKDSFFNRYKLPLIFIMGILIYVIHDLIMLATQASLEGTLYFARFQEFGHYNYFVFSNLGEYFRFYNHIDFDWSLILLALALTVISFSNTVNMYRGEGEEVSKKLKEGPTLDSKILLDSGLTLANSAFAIPPFELISEEVRYINKKEKIINTTFLMGIIILVFALPLEYILQTIPEGIYFAFLFLFASRLFINGFNLIKAGVKEQGKLRTGVGVILILLLGFILGGFFLAEIFLGYTLALSLTIGSVKINFFLIIIVASFILNIVLPLPKQKGEDILPHE